MGGGELQTGRITVIAAISVAALSLALAALALRDRADTAAESRAEPSRENAACGSIRTILEQSTRYREYLARMEDHYRDEYWAAPAGSIEEAQHLSYQLAYQSTGAAYDNDGLTGLSIDPDYAGVHPVIEAAMIEHDCP